MGIWVTRHRPCVPPQAGSMRDLHGDMGDQGLQVTRHRTCIPPRVSSMRNIHYKTKCAASLSNVSVIDSQFQSFTHDIPYVTKKDQPINTIIISFPITILY